jgi:adenine nucleotide transporter 17
VTGGVGFGRRARADPLPFLLQALAARLTARRARRVAAAASRAPWAAAAKGSAGLPKLSAADVFAASALAKLGATLLTYPLLLVKQRLQAAGRHTRADRRYKGAIDAIFRIWREDGGLPAFYSGLRAKLAQSIAAAALLMAVKEEIAAAVQGALLPGGGVPALAAAR